MIYDVSKLNATKIVIGRRGENLATSIEIDVSAWLAEWPSAGIQVVVMRPGDTAPYVANTSVSNGVLSWPVTNVDTENAGKGKIEVRATSGEVMKKSVIATIEIEPCILCDENADPPELDPALVDQAVAAAARAESAVQEAKDILGDGLSWDEMVEKPDVFPPASHGHNQSDITGLSSALTQRDRVRNLLDNSDFRAGHFFAQAGQNGLHGATKYVGDRWISWSADAAFTDEYITPGSPIDQRVSRSVVDLTKTYTAAICLADGTIKVASGTFAAGFGSYNIGIYCMAADSSLSYVSVRLNSGISIRWAALYEGEYTADTLPTYQPRGYAAELAECMRYFQRFPYLCCANGQWGFYQGYMNFIIPMRLSPTITLYAYATGAKDAYTDVSANNVDVTGAQANNANAYGFRAQNSGQLTSGHFYHFIVEASADL